MANRSSISWFTLCKLITFGQKRDEFLLAMYFCVNILSQPNHCDIIAKYLRSHHNVCTLYDQSFYKVY